MPIIKSARKRVKVAASAKSRNARTKRNLRDALKSFTKAMSDGKAAEIAKAERAVISAIDTAAKKDIIHRNKAARQKSQISRKVKSAGVKSTKSSPKKATAQKPTPKKAPAKKSAAKKTAPKKPAGKK